MTDSPSPVPLTFPSRAEHTFPTLTAAQIARIAAHGRRPSRSRGEVLVEAGDRRSSRSSWSRPARSRSSGPSGTAETLIASIGRASSPAKPTCSRAAARSSALACQRAGRSDRAGSRALAGARADRRRAERDPHAGVHPAPRGAHCARARGRRARRVDALRRHAARQGVPDTQRPSVRLHRPRPRRRRPGAARSVSRRRRRRARC